MELCKESLRSRIFLHPDNIPGASTDPATMTKVIRWAGNIASALKFLHEREIVHRDLKLEKILVSPWVLWIWILNGDIISSYKQPT